MHTLIEQSLEMDRKKYYLTQAFELGEVSFQTAEVQVNMVICDTN